MSDQYSEMLLQQYGAQQVADRVTNPPVLPEEEWKAWQALPPKKGPVYAGPDRDIFSMIDTNPEGFVVHKQHKDIQNLPGDVEIFSIPGNDKDFFVRPRKSAFVA